MIYIIINMIRLLGYVLKMCKKGTKGIKNICTDDKDKRVKFEDSRKRKRYAHNPVELQPLA